MRTKERDNWLKHLIPREHGAWAMWLLPFIIGAVAAANWTSATWLLLLACLLIFAARTAFGSAIRMRRRNRTIFIKCALTGVAESLLALMCVWPLVTGNRTLLLLGAAALVLFMVDLLWIKDRSERTVSAEILGVAGFTLTAPAAYIVSGGESNSSALILWLVSFGFFAGSIVHVKLRLARLSGKPNHRAQLYERWAVVYVIAIVVVTILLSIFRWAPGWLVVAFAPWMVHILWEAFNVRPQKNIYRVGWTLVAHSLFFAGMVSLIFALN